MLEGLGKIVRRVFEAPGQFLENLDPIDGNGPEDMGGIGVTATRMAEKYTKEWPHEG